MNPKIQAPVVVQEAQATITVPSSESSNSKKLMLGLLLIIVVVVTGALGYYLLSSSSIGSRAQAPKSAVSVPAKIMISNPPANEVEEVDQIDTTIPNYTEIGAIEKDLKGL